MVETTFIVHPTIFGVGNPAGVAIPNRIVLKAQLMASFCQSYRFVHMNVHLLLNIMHDQAMAAVSKLTFTKIKLVQPKRRYSRKHI
jgi:hypothetical protein